MDKTGFAFHVHHDKLVEWCTDYDARVAYIKSNKPETEQELRLRLFQLIPPDRVPSVLDKARNASIKAWDASIKARNTIKARNAFIKARDAYVKAWDASLPEFIKLHSELCPDCTWNGKTIFTES